MKTNKHLLVVVAPLMALACQDTASGTDSNAIVAAASSATIPQPSLDKLEELTRSRLAPESRRVDLAVPTFNHPTQVTNPLFPISNLHSALLVGRFEGQPWRAETTLLPETRMVEWNGKKIETLQSQFVAYLNGRIYEVAVDLYAQADDGSVWYFGEDAFSYERGRISEVNETWHAGVDGPATMIMPGKPRVGDVYRPENIPGLIFEEVTVKEIGATRAGPIGEIKGVMVGQELHMEGDVEDKSFAPGHGELRSGLGEDYEATALANPADVVPDALPTEIPKILDGAVQFLEATRMQDWEAASAGVDQLRVADGALRKHRLPKQLDTQLADALDMLAKAVEGRDTRAALLAPLGVAVAAADLMLRYRPPVEVDLVRFDLWARQLVVDARVGEKSAVAGDVATMKWIRDRIAFDGHDARSIDDQLRYLTAAADAKDMESAAKAAERLRTSLARVAQQ